MSNPVLIVGAGPVGLTMALELARYRIPVRLVDKEPARSRQSRAIAIWARTLELLDRADVSQDLIACGNRVDAANIIAGGHQIARLDFSGVPSPYPYALMIPQCDTERVLEKHVQRYDARCDLGVEMTAFEQDRAGVTATLRLADGRSETQRFSFLIACDGAHSCVRHALGLPFEGDATGEEWGLGDFRINAFPFRSNELVTFWHKDGPIIFFPMGGERYRFVAGLEQSSTAFAGLPTHETLQAIIDQRGPGGVTLSECFWTSSFRISERQAARYRVGRVFLAGDSAHVHSPAGGQGMNTGMQDAINLAWKLAMALGGSGQFPALLDSYDTERRPVGAAVIATTAKLTRAATLAGPITQRIRNTIAHFALGLAPVQRAIGRSMTEISVRYEVSPLNGADNRRDFLAGMRMPPIADEKPYGSGREPRFTLRASTAPNKKILTRFADIIDPTIRDAPEGGGIALVRPDGYLALTVADDDWAAVEGYLARLSSGAITASERPAA